MASWSSPPMVSSIRWPVFQSTSSTSASSASAWKMASMRPRITQGPRRRMTPDLGLGWRKGGVAGGRDVAAGPFDQLGGQVAAGAVGELVGLQQVGEVAGTALQQAVDHRPEPGRRLGRRGQRPDHRPVEVAGAAGVVQHLDDRQDPRRLGPGRRRVDPGGVEQVVAGATAAEGVGLTRRDPGLQRPRGGLLQLHRRGEALGEHRVVLVLGTAAGMGPADALPEPLGERAGGGLLGLDEDLHRRMAGRLGPERAGALEIFSEPWYHQAEVSTSSCLARVMAT